MSRELSLRDHVEILKQHYDNFDANGTIVIKNKKRNTKLYILEDGTFELFLDGKRKCKSSDEKLFNMVVIFFENPIHLLEHIGNLKVTLNSYVYKKRAELEEQGHTSIVYNELGMWFTNKETSSTRCFSIKTLTGDITDEVINR